MPHLTLIDAASRSTSVSDAPKKKKWISKAVKPENKGKFRAKAERAGESTREFAKEHAGDSGTLSKEARLAQTLMGMHKGKRKGLYSHPSSGKM